MNEATADRPTDHVSALALDALALGSLDAGSEVRVASPSRELRCVSRRAGGRHRVARSVRGSHVARTRNRCGSGDRGDGHGWRFRCSRLPQRCFVMHATARRTRRPRDQR